MIRKEIRTSFLMLAVGTLGMGACNFDGTLDICVRNGTECAGGNGSGGGDGGSGTGGNGTGGVGGTPDGSGGSGGTGGVGGAGGDGGQGGSTPSFCGDGNLDPGEDCDDGNETPGDGCSPSCLNESNCMEEDPVPVEPYAYGCDPIGLEFSYDPPGPDPAYDIECLCPNPDDGNKGTWLPAGSDCDDVDLCWVPGDAPSLSETCPGEPYTLAAGDPIVVIQGTTVGASDDLTTCFDFSDDDAERVYHLTLTTGGTLRLHLMTDEGLEADLVYNVTSCEATDDPAGRCVSTGTPEEAMGFEIAGPEEAWVIIDSHSGTAGAYELMIEFTPIACGDGVINTGEECDGGPGTTSDGCVDPGDPGECTYEPPAAGTDTCPGEAIAVPAGASMLAIEDGYTTNGYTDNYMGSCLVASGGVDRVMAIDPAVTGSLTVRIGYEADNETLFCDSGFSTPGCWDQVLFARTDCDDGGTELTCADDDYRAEEITFDVIEDEIVYLFVDGYDGEYYSQGPFTLHFALTP